MRLRSGMSAPEKPGQQLPIAACPPMLPGCRGFVMGRKGLEQLNISRERRTSEEAFKEIMAEHRVVWHLVRQGRLEGVDLVNAFAGIRPFTKQILVHIRHGGCIGIDPAGAGKRSLKTGALPVCR